MENLYFYFLPPLFLFLYSLCIYFHHRLQNLPPTPFPPLPFIGHLYLFRAKEPLHRAFSKLSKRYGPVIFLQLGSRRALLVSSPLIAEECFTKNDIIFANRPNLLNGKVFGDNYTSLPWSPYGDHWRNLRRISSLHLLSSHRIQTSSNIRSDEARIFIRKLIQFNNDNPKKAVDMK
ncbi:Cytochrome [Abeliophyllum distichum]|uniref:Cytochrome n=1 Tax=Abeliophyllum distichum TaxID=126358 RepID=A0ABD1TDI9_9LAMI